MSGLVLTCQDLIRSVRSFMVGSAVHGDLVDFFIREYFDPIYLTKFIKYLLRNYLTFISAIVVRH